MTNIGAIRDFGHFPEKIAVDTLATRKEGYHDALVGDCHRVGGRYAISHRRIID
jgi:hypothetical protein